MKLFTAGQMRDMDNAAISGLHIPSLTLMENAARHVARAAEKAAAGNHTAAVLAGSGNNGGDGLAAARMLLEDGWQVRVFLVGKRDKMTPDCRAMAAAFTAAGGLLEDFTGEAGETGDYFSRCGVIIDAMFGVGLHSALRAPADAAARLANRSAAPVVAADIPSGVMVDTGGVPGEAVRAQFTVTFSFAKPGLIAEPGCYYTGDLSVCDIGIPSSVTAAAVCDITTPEPETCRLPRRPADGYKGTFGRNLILAGSVGYTGAPVLAAEAAVRSGAGLVFLGVPEEIYTIAAVKCTSAMPFPLPAAAGGLSERSWPAVEQRLLNCDVCLVGPGLGRGEETVRLVQQVIRRCRVPLVIDADGIYALAQNINLLDEASCPVILTPHAGEFRRLGGQTEGSPLAVARDFAVRHHCTLVYKGHRTVTAFADGSAVINTTGNPGMGKGGSGDVLAGMIAALVGQGMDIRTAVPAAVYLHGRAGDECAARLGEYAMTPSDMIGALCQVLKQ